MAPGGQVTGPGAVAVPWRWVCWGIGIVLLIVAGGVLLFQVSVHGAGTPPRACGSAWDVVTGRAGWPQWWAADLADPVAGSSGQPVRTLSCPGAVNDRIIASGGLALGAVAVVSVSEVVIRRRLRPAGLLPGGRARRLRLFGTAVTTAGGLLTAGGLAAIAILAADPGSPVFLYVSRPVAVLVGLLLLLPAVVLIVLGRGISLLAGYLAHVESPRETS